MFPANNAAMAEYWNGPTGQRWAQAQERMDARLRPFSLPAMDAVGIAEGARIVDVGCGCGGTSFDLAERCGATGSVLGLDIADTMLARARKRVAAEGAKNITFVQGDAQAYAFDTGTFDVVFSRFGVMFFDDPPAAFRNLATALHPDGRLAFVCWRPMQENEWAHMPLAVLGNHIDLPAPSEPGAPGPFAFADPERVRRILTETGFADVTCAATDTSYVIGNDLDDAVAFLLQFGPTSRAISLAEPDDATKARIAEDLRAALAPHDSGSGIALNAATWIVTAGKP